MAVIINAPATGSSLLPRPLRVPEVVAVHWPLRLFYACFIHACARIYVCKLKIRMPYFKTAFATLLCERQVHKVGGEKIAKPYTVTPHTSKKEFDFWMLITTFVRRSWSQLWTDVMTTNARVWWGNAGCLPYQRAISQHQSSIVIN